MKLISHKQVNTSSEHGD